MDLDLETLAAIERCDEVGSVQSIVRDAVRAHGYDRSMMLAMSASRDELLDAIYWVEGKWFDDGEAPDAETYLRHCPVTRHVVETDLPFFWTKTSSDRGKKHRFVSAPRGVGVHGLQVPVFGRAGLVGAASFGGERVDSAPRVRLALTQLGVTAFFAIRALLESRRPAGAEGLSARELEVLGWIAAGRRVADVAATLGLSDRTVENHLRRIRNRLRVTTTAQAISAAIRSGLIRS